MTQKNIIVALLLIVSFGFSQSKKNRYEVVSTNGNNKIKFELVKNAPKYAVSHGKTKVITPSDMGFLLKRKWKFKYEFWNQKCKNHFIWWKLGTAMGRKEKDYKPLQSISGRITAKKGKTNVNWRFSFVLFF